MKLINPLLTLAAVLATGATGSHAQDPNARIDPETGTEIIEKIPSPDEQLKNFTLAPGYEVNLYASEVDSPLYNPVGMAFDEQGRLWVITSPTFPHLIPGTNPKDKLLYLEDTDGDGKADKHTIFLDDLLIPTGLALDTDGVYLAQQPNIWFVQDTDGDGKADRKQVVLEGFSVEDSHHATSAFTWGPDGAFYFNEGVFLYTQVETPYGPKRSRDAGVHRFKPSTQRFDVMSHRDYSNPWGMAFDRWGQSVALRRLRRKSLQLCRRHFRLRLSGENHPACFHAEARPPDGWQRDRLQPSVPRRCPGHPSQQPVHRIPRYALGPADRRWLRLAHRGIARLDSVERPDLPPRCFSLWTGRRSLYPRLLQSSHRPHVFFPERSESRPFTRPHLAHHSGGQTTAEDAKDPWRIA
ncbi:MAG: hypothetical protein R3F19_33015 [Verrucomicrobiales bacterium]